MQTIIVKHHQHHHRMERVSVFNRVKVAESFHEIEAFFRNILTLTEG